MRILLCSTLKNFGTHVLSSADNAKYLADTIERRITFIVNSALASNAEERYILKYIDYFANAIKKWYQSGQLYCESPATKSLRLLNYDASAYLALHIRTNNDLLLERINHLNITCDILKQKLQQLNQKLTQQDTKVEQMGAKLSEQARLISLLVNRDKLTKSYRFIQFKLLFAIGKRRLKLKEKKKAIKQQLRELRSIR